MISILHNTGSISVLISTREQAKGVLVSTNGVWGFVVKIFSSFLKFLPGSDVDHLSIWSRALRQSPSV